MAPNPIILRYHIGKGLTVPVTWFAWNSSLMYQNTRLFSKSSSFGWETRPIYDFHQLKEFCISQGSAVTFIRCGNDKCIITCGNFRQDFVYKKLLNNNKNLFIFDGVIQETIRVRCLDHGIDSGFSYSWLSPFMQTIISFSKDLHLHDTIVNTCIHVCIPFIRSVCDHLHNKCLLLLLHWMMATNIRRCYTHCDHVGI